MFLRVALLLLLTGFLVIESSKIQNFLKKVNKRFFFDESEWFERGLGLTNVESLTESWNEFTDMAVAEVKDSNARRVRDHLVQLSSKEHAFYDQAEIELPALMSPDMTAKVCGEDGKTMNALQYLKYLRQSAAQYKKSVIKSYNMTIFATDRNVLSFKVYVSHTDKFDVPVEIEYQVDMDMTFGTKVPRKQFSISHIYQGGSCGEHGKVDHVKIYNEGDDYKEFKNHPTSKMFFRLFRPIIYEDANYAPYKVPWAWLESLTGDTKISICQEKVKDPVEYSAAQFRSWYKHFGLMWRPKHGVRETISLQVLDLKDDSIVARVTMKLQMGFSDNAEGHDWNFKFSAKLKQYSENFKTWTIDQLDVLCDPTLNYKDQSLHNIRDVIAARYVDDVKDLPSPLYYNEAEFVRSFTNHGHFEFYYCDNDHTSKLTRLQLYFLGNDARLYPRRYLNYWVENDDVTLPAADSVSIGFSTNSVADVKNPPTVYENDWKFDLKWNQMDQFYYIEKVNFGCQKKKTATREWKDYEKYKDILERNVNIGG